jgi:glutamate synthase domain-containing protein 2/glutamate synthase domain-containing protein 1/glutamate synthase domain-containing protein 3
VAIGTTLYDRTLFDSRAELDACGIGFVADVRGRPSRAVLDALLEGLRRVKHRGAVAADGKTGDGAGLLLPIPATLLPAPGCGLGMVFLRDESDRETLATLCCKEGLEVVGWRPVPVDPDALGEEARASAPRIEQLVLAAPGLDTDEAERRAFRARKRAERSISSYVVSLSFRTVTYKALCAADQLAAFYDDLRDQALEIPFGIFHQRFSTNTAPSWERAQPFRLLCHNGEINAIQGNVNWMHAREGRLGSDDDALLAPVVDPRGSDSAMLDNVLELLVRGGRDVRHGLAMLVPEAWEGNAELDPAVRDFYRYHSGLCEPWDGPAALVFTDGRVVGATLDRNGLRPLRYAVGGDLVVCASEAGVMDLPDGPVRRGKLGPGEMIAVDPERGLEENATVKRRLAARAPYGVWLAQGLLRGSCGEPLPVPEEDLTARQAAFGYTQEDLRTVLRPTAAHAHEPTSSMGDDTALAPLAGRARPLYSFFRQRFAQVTNPPIDHLRERFVFSLRTLLGGRSPILVEGPSAARGMELESFFLFPDALAGLDAEHLDATFSPDEGLEAALGRVVAEAEAAVRAGRGMLLLSDSGVGPERAPVPMLLAVGAVHDRLIAEELRTFATIVVESDEPREVHHFACLLGYGAETICPRLALETVAALAAGDKLGSDRPDPDEAQIRFRRAIEDGVLKVMSKMGISDVASYCGGQLFDIVGLAGDVVDRCFEGTSSAVGGLGFTELEQDVLERHARAWTGAARLENPGFVKFRKGGERHATDPEVVEALHEVAAAHALRKAVRDEDRQRYERFADLVNGREPLELRDLLELAPAGAPVPLDEVEPAESIVRRFSSGAMSHGALSAEAHETVAIAFNRLGARANSGEGGEDPARFRDERNCRIKQVASGRFGVTPEYAVFAEELQIKIAQGSKPGEGGQLPGHKVTAEIARLRHTQPGVALISPPPHHDIYSIEDLAQLVFDLRQVSPDAAVSVKLVSEAGVGLVAAGCVKALADVVHIAGADGGTGASPLSSIKNAGVPWELGLAETQQTLVANRLRGRVRLRADGGMKTGRDVVVAALLGADEVSFGTAVLIAQGCLMVRSCHLDTCPVGIATQRPDLREKFEATPEQVMAYLLFVAEEVRGHLAALGFRTFDEAIGRVECLGRRSRGDDRAGLLDLGPLLAAAGDGPARYAGEPQLRAEGGELGERLAGEAQPALEGASIVEPLYPICTDDRAVGARLGGLVARRFGAGAPPGRVRARFEGSAGQSFGAFLAAGVQLELVGEANDYVGKSMGGGRIVVRPPADDAGDPVLLGNTVLYGATGGELFCAGRAGERFGVRNSGATAVVEGVGQHACEYMTSGTVVVLGGFGRNVGAGMSGGELYVHDPEDVLPLRLNSDLVVSRPVGVGEELRRLLERHVRYTGSGRGQALLDRWEEALREFRRVVPKADVAAVEDEHEGTLPGGKHAEGEVEAAAVAP